MVTYDQSATGSTSSGGSFTITLSTAGTNRLLIFNGHTTNNTSLASSITGGGLTWVKISGKSLEANGFTGQTEVWRAFAPTQLTGEVFTINTPGTADQRSGVISAYYNTDSSGTNGSGAIGTVTVGGPTPDLTPEYSLNTVRDNSIVIGCIGVTGYSTLTAGRDQTVNAQVKNADQWSSSAQIRKDNVTPTAHQGAGIFGTMTKDQYAQWAMFVIEIKEAGTDASDTWSFNMGAHVYCKYSETGGDIDDTNTYLDAIVAKGIDTVRLDIPDYLDATWLADSKVAVLSAISKGLNVIWGVTSACIYGNPQYLFTKENWPTFVTACLSAATWAQANGVYEFQVANEVEINNAYVIPAASLSRTSNVVTVTTPINHVFTVDNQVTIENATPSSFNGTFTITDVTANSFKYAATGDNGTSSTDARAYNISNSDARQMVLDLVDDVKEVYTIGKVSYSASNGLGYNYYLWGKRNLDVLGLNLYTGGPPWTEYWKTSISEAIAALGAGNVYITEFNLCWSGFSNYTTQDEDTIAADLKIMSDYIRASGIRRAIFFNWNLDNFNCYSLNTSYNDYYYAVFELVGPFPTFLR